GAGRTVARVKVWPLGLVVLCVLATGAGAQDSSNLPAAPTPSPSVQRLPYAPQAATAEPLPLSLDEAIDRGLQHNLQVQLAKQNELTVHGGILSAGNALLPNMNAVVKTQTQAINLAAMGFKPSSLAGLGLA